VATMTNVDGEVLSHSMTFGGGGGLRIGSLLKYIRELSVEVEDLDMW
jgi:hypothetical protein